LEVTKYQHFFQKNVVILVDIKLSCRVKLGGEYNHFSYLLRYLEVFFDKFQTVQDAFSEADFLVIIPLETMAQMVLSVGEVLLFVAVILSLMGIDGNYDWWIREEFLVYSVLEGVMYGFT